MAKLVFGVFYKLVFKVLYKVKDEIGIPKLSEIVYSVIYGNNFGSRFTKAFLPP